MAAKQTRKPRTAVSYPVYQFKGLVISSGHYSDVRATATVAIALGPKTSTTAFINFCDADKFANFNDSAGPTGFGPWYFYFPLELLSEVMDIIQNNPKKFIGMRLDAQGKKALGTVGYSG
jgi:hypothetical protein